MTDLTIRQIQQEEAADYIRIMFWAAGRPVDEEFVEEQRKAFSLDLALAAFSKDGMIGTIGTRSLSLTLPGGRAVPVAAIGQGGVLPSHTRRGAMRALMLEALRAAREREEPLAAWTTSEWPIYERYGGGPASFSASYRLSGPGRSALRDAYQPLGRVRMVDSKVALKLLPELHQRASRRNGGVPRDHSYWKRAVDRLQSGASLDVLESRRDLPASLFCTRFDDAGRADGCCVYRVHQNWKAGLSRATLEVLYFLTTSPESAIDLWSFLLGTDLVADVRIPHGSVDEALRWLLVDGRRLETLGIQDHMWLRLITPAVVLGHRSFPALPAPLRIKIHDPLQFGHGTLEIHSDGSTTDVAATEGAPEVAMGIGTLSSLVLGGTSVWSLAAAGRIEAFTQRALSRTAMAFGAVESPFVDTSF